MPFNENTNFIFEEVEFFCGSSRIKKDINEHLMLMSTINTNRRLDGNYTKMLPALMNKSWRQHPIKQQLYGHLPLISKTIQIRRTRHVGHCWRSKDWLISDVLLWTPSHGRERVGLPARTNVQQLCTDTWCSLEDQPKAIDDRDERQGRVTTWWWRWCIALSRSRSFCSVATAVTWSLNSS